MKTFLTLAVATLLAMGWLHVHADLQIWDLSVEVYRNQLNADQEEIKDIRDLAHLDGHPMTPADKQKGYAVFDRVEENVRTMLDLLNHKPYGLHLDDHESLLLGYVVDMQTKLNSLDRNRDRVSSPATAPAIPASVASVPQVPAVANPRATPDPRKVAEDIARRYATKPGQ